MASIQDVLDAQAQADAAQRLLEGYCSNIEDGQVTERVGLVVGLAAVALCERLNALTMRVGYELKASRAS